MFACCVRVETRVCTDGDPTGVRDVFAREKFGGSNMQNSGPPWAQTMIFGVLDMPNYIVFAWYGRLGVS